MKTRGIERRQHARIELDGWHIAEDLTAGRPVRICDVSAGGFQTQSDHAPRLGAQHRFRIALGGEEPRLVAATAVHVRTPSGATQPCVVGWRVAADADSADAISRLVETVTTVARYEP